LISYYIRSSTSDVDETFFRYNCEEIFIWSNSPDSPLALWNFPLWRPCSPLKTASISSFTSHLKSVMTFPFTSSRLLTHIAVPWTDWSWKHPRVWQIHLYFKKDFLRMHRTQEKIEFKLANIFRESSLTIRMRLIRVRQRYSGEISN